MQHEKHEFIDIKLIYNIISLEKLDLQKYISKLIYIISTVRWFYSLLYFFWIEDNSFKLQELMTARSENNLFLRKKIY